MEVLVDIIKCAKHKVTPNEYIVLKILELKKQDEVRSYVDFKSCVLSLIQKELLDKDGNITQLGRSLLKGDANEQWETFKSLYPTKDGARRLHNRPSVCREKFKKLVNCFFC